MTERATLVPLVERLERACVLVVGDLMLDRFVAGRVDRISPEGPIPVLRVEKETAMLGGAGNVARNLAALGSSVRLVTTVGDDAAGAEVRGLVDAIERVEAAFVTDPDRPTAIKARYLAGGQQLMRADWERPGALSQAIGAAVEDAFGQALEAADVVVLSDYGKGVLADGRAARLIDAARAKGKPVIVDPKGTDYGRYAGADLVTPNRSELRDAAGMSVDDAAAVAAAASRLIADHGLGAVLATRSQDGMTLVEAAGGTTHLPAEAREVFDVSGAGDTVVATLAAACGAGATLVDAARLANVAAGIVVAKVGTAVAYADDVIAALHHQDLSDAENKIVGAERARDWVERWHRRGLRVGFTNGCFDLLHPGHVSLLRQAKAACDRLVVGLNSDSSVARLKGEGRPVQNEAARAAVLASLEVVDAVVVFDDDTPLALITTLRPEVLVKGADYTVETVVGSREIESWGGRVVLAELEPGHSTTATIRRLSRED